jgi:pimeloyl-ACP methyl ester carboxylesterase
VRQGAGGFAQDITIENQPWQFDVAAIVAPVKVFHGETDVFLLVGHSRHTAEIIPGATFEIVQGHGHLSVFAAFPRFVRDLADAIA